MINHLKDRVFINGFEMYFEIYGEGTPVLMLHGFTGSGAGVLESFKQLGSNHLLIIPDLRGHGRSTNPTQTFTFHQAALDVLALLDHLNINQCSAIGFSGGGCTLLHLAYLKPERIKAMALVSVAPYFPEQAKEIMTQFSRQEKTEEEWAAMRSIHFHGDEQIQWLWLQPKVLSEGGDMDFKEQKLAQIATKTLIVQGDRDPIYPIELTIEMYQAMPQAYLWIVPNGAHVPISADSMAEFLSYLKRFDIIVINHVG